MSFSIRLDSAITYRDNQPIAIGEINIGTFSEFFHSPLTYWDRNDYIKSWMKCYESRHMTSNRVSLVISMNDPKTANFLFVWALYFEGDTVYIQNSIIFADQIKGPIDENKMNDYIRPREICSEDGGRISEWSSSKGDVDDFFKSLARQINTHR